MPKAFFVSAYRNVRDPAKVAAYAALAGPAIQASGGRFLARGQAEAAFEAGVAGRTVIVEFESVEAAKAMYGSAAYREALAALGDGAERDIRIVEAVG